jgi:YidC/Oxa1 family membrane protein insertase
MLADVFLIQPLIDVFEAVLVFFHDNLKLEWGLAIIALTVTIRALLLPLTLKQVRSMREMQRIAPLMKDLQAKYKDDRQRLNQEMMKLYQEHKVNPFASCLPLLAQLPVFISLFYMLRLDLRHEICPDKNPQAVLDAGNTVPCGSTPESDFLFIPDITNKATGAVLIVLLVLYVGSQLASSLLMSVSADPRQKYIFLALPFVFIPFIIGFPAGLLVYWITTNVWTIAQQLIVKRTVGPVPEPLTAASGGGGSGGGRGGSGGGGARGGGGKKAGTAVAAESGGNGAPRGPRSAPPPPPRKRKKQRSGRRR